MKLVLSIFLAISLCACATTEVIEYNQVVITPVVTGQYDKALADRRRSGVIVCDEVDSCGF